MWCYFRVAQRHYSQLKDELLKLKRPTDDTVAASDLVPSDAAHSITVNGDPVSTNESVSDGSVPADEVQDASSSLLPTSANSAAAESASSTAVNDAATDSNSLVTDGSSAAVA